jgi:hypothetical protein
MKPFYCERCGRRLIESDGTYTANATSGTMRQGTRRRYVIAIGVDSDGNVVRGNMDYVSCLACGMVHDRPEVRD